MNKGTNHSILTKGKLHNYSCGPVYRTASVQYVGNKIPFTQTGSTFQNFHQPSYVRINSSQYIDTHLPAVVDLTQKVNETTHAYNNEKGIKTLSSLCYAYRQNKEDINKVSNFILDKETIYVGLFTGGVTASFLTEPVLVKSKINAIILVNKLDWACILPARLNV